MSDPVNMNTNTKTAEQGIGNIQIQQLFKVMVENGASDLHITVGSAPGMRISGDIVRVKVGSLTPDDTKRLIYQILTEKQKAELEKNLELDFSFGIKGLARFRANVFYSKGSTAAVFRQIPSLIPDFDALGLPPVLMEMVNVSSGLFLVTGPTGSGKSTTLASIIDKLNSSGSNHIITLEDPIEFVHQHKMSLVNQREVGADTLSFGKGIKSLLRQDPDIVLVGELRDPETIEAALTIAETGHVVFGTLHTNSTVQTINRIINVFSHEQQEQIRTLLSFVLQGVVAQQLLPKIPKGRALVQEILRITPAIRNLIREDKIHQIYSQMQIGQEESGMNTMNQHIRKHVEGGVITPETAMTYSNNPEELARMLGLNNSPKKRS
jgi:twitching motility protein PilT